MKGVVLDGTNSFLVIGNDLGFDLVKVGNNGGKFKVTFLPSFG
jgi:hypothetical protein